MGCFKAFLGVVFSFILAAPVAAETVSKAGSQLRQRFLTPDETVIVVAHRACWRETTENAVSSIEACIRLGVDMVEVDVRRTRDGVLVLMHDETVDRTTSGSGRVEDMDYADFKTLRLKSQAGGGDAVLTAEAPPTLEAALIAARGRILVNLDMKADLYTEALHIAQKVGAQDIILIKAYLAPGDPRLAFVDQLGGALFMPVIGQCTPTKKRDYCPETGTEAIRAFAAYPASAYEIVFHDPAFFRDAAALAQSGGRRIWANTLQPGHAAGLVDADAVRDPDAVWGRLIRLGAKIIQTDNPRELHEYLIQRVKPESPNMP
ncbi:MAG: glycerophosphodiester phosphodiesterase family protein [Asticcacaulis sp.]